MILNWTDPIVLKAGGGLALYAFGGSRTTRLLGLALVGWAAWEYYQAPAKAPPKLIPYDPDAPMPLEQAVTSSPPVPGDPFKGTRWEGARYSPSVRPLRPGESAPAGVAKVIPLRPPSLEDRSAFYGINPDPGDNVG